MAKWPYNTARWQRLRKQHLQLERFCRGCAPRLVVANTVDHVHPISEGGPAFPSHDGLASYCPACHSRKTARGSEAGRAKTNKPRKGCDLQGNPIDPEHPWHVQAPNADLAKASCSLDNHCDAVQGRGRSGVLDSAPVNKSLEAGAIGAHGDHKTQLVNPLRRKSERG